MNDVLGEQRMNCAWTAYSPTLAWAPAAQGDKISAAQRCGLLLPVVPPSASSQACGHSHSLNFITPPNIRSSSPPRHPRPPPAAPLNTPLPKQWGRPRPGQDGLSVP